MGIVCSTNAICGTFGGAMVLIRLYINLRRSVEIKFYCRLIFDACRNFILLILSYSCDRLYSNTLAITTEVLSADNPVTGLLNNKTESHIRKALFAVFATLEYGYVIFRIYKLNIF